MKAGAREAEEAIRSLDQEMMESDLERMKARARFWGGWWTLLLTGFDSAVALLIFWVALFKASHLLGQVALAVLALLFVSNVLWMLRKRRYWRRMEGTIALMEKAAAGG